VANVTPPLMHGTNCDMGPGGKRVHQRNFGPNGGFKPIIIIINGIGKVQVPVPL